MFPWERAVARLGIRNLEGEAQPIAIGFRAKPPPYALSWRVFQRIAEHRPRMRNFVKVRVRNALTVWGTVKRHFGLNSHTARTYTSPSVANPQSEKALFCLNPGNNLETIEHRQEIVIESIRYQQTD